MARRVRVALPATIAVVSAAAFGGCFGGHGGSPDAVRARTQDTRLRGPVAVERIVYSTSHGNRVPALFAVPRGVSPRGCLIWENGLNARKEDPTQIWDGAARLGLAVFTMDLRQQGQLGDEREEAQRAITDPSRLAAFVRGSVADLSTGVDYLEQRRECRQNLGYAGLGLGGMVGSVLAGRDPRIRATVIMSSAPSWGSQPILSPLDPVRWIPRISPRPVLVMSGRNDPLIPPDAAAQVQSAARAPKRVVNYRGGHSPFRGPDAARNALAIERFLLRWLVRPTYPP
jgi:pimeloyl-ACP methyl ester carboxylesterase